MFSYVWSTGRTFVASSPHKFSKSYRILRWTRSLSSHLRIHVQCRLKTSFVRWIITVLINLLVLSKQYIQSLILTINYRKPWWFCFELEYSTTDSRRLRTRYGTVSLTFFFYYRTFKWSYWFIGWRISKILPFFKFMIPLY